MREHILIAEDEEEIADLLEVYLENDVYIVHKLTNGTDAAGSGDSGHYAA